jgi:hypothetical protein
MITSGTTLRPSLKKINNREYQCSKKNPQHLIPVEKWDSEKTWVIPIVKWRPQQREEGYHKQKK